MEFCSCIRTFDSRWLEDKLCKVWFNTEKCWSWCSDSRAGSWVRISLCTHAKFTVCVCMSKLQKQKCKSAATKTVKDTYIALSSLGPVLQLWHVPEGCGQRRGQTSAWITKVPALPKKCNVTNVIEGGGGIRTSYRINTNFQWTFQCQCLTAALKHNV